MNREIKFRAWNIPNKLMYQNVQDGILAENEKGQLIIGVSIGKLSKDAGSILMQFTGLKDRNGIDVYEGDLLREPSKSNWENVNFSCFEVFFHDGDSHLNYDIGYTMCRMHNHGSICGGHIPSFKPKTLSKMEVIGNIYENPELIK